MTTRTGTVGSVLVAFLMVAAASMAQPPSQPGPQAGSRMDRSVTQQGDNVREAAPVPGISFIDSPSVTCYQPNPLQNACYLNVYYMSVDASPNYMLYMRWFIKDHLVSNTSGFFQTSMYVPFNMLGQGFKVPCGRLGSGGDPLLGQSYSWIMRAEDSANLKSANYGTTWCPAFTGGWK